MGPSRTHSGSGERKIGVRGVKPGYPVRVSTSRALKYMVRQTTPA